MGSKNMQIMLIIDRVESQPVAASTPLHLTLATTPALSLEREFSFKVALTKLVETK